MDDAPGAGDRHEPAGQAAVVDVAGEVAVDALQPSGVEAGVGGIDLDLQFSHGVEPYPAPSTSVSRAISVVVLAVSFRFGDRKLRPNMR